MRSTFLSFALTFAATALLLQSGVLPNAWGNADPAGFEARHASENKAEVEAKLGLSGA